MDLFYKHYEKLILVVCLILMIVGLLKVSQTVSEANADRKKDIETKANTLDPSRGDMVADFNPKLFTSKEEWIQRIKENRPAPVISIAEILASPRDTAKEDFDRMCDRRYFGVLTRHSRKPIEETEAKYKLEKNTKTLASLKDSVRQCEDAIRKRIAESGDNEDDTRLAELKMQLEGYQVLLANTEMDIVEISNRIKYISMFCTEQGSLVDPHEVICCPNPNCGSLLLSKEDTCPFCGAKMPLINPAEDAGKDSDGDGFPDEFELAHAQKRGFIKPMANRNPDGEGGMMERGGGREGSQPGTLDPYNPNDAHEDFDNDFSTNLEEYRFGTDIDDERDFPAPANFVRIDKFERDKLPFRLMGINDGRAGKDQKVAKWRARFSFMRKIRGREVWEKNEDNYEQVKIGKRFETPDGKEFILEDLDEEDVGGEKRAVAIVKEFIRPAKPVRRPAGRGAEGAAAEPEPEKREAKTYTLHQDQDAFYDTMYAHIIYFVSRNLSVMDNIYTYGRFILQSGAKTYRIQTRFKLEEGAIVKLVVPVLKRDATAAPAADAPQKQGRFNRFRNNNPGGDMMERGGDMERGGGMTSQEYELKEFQYKLTKFNVEAKTLTLVPVDAKDAELSFSVKAFDEEEMAELPSKKMVPFFYEGRSMEGVGGGERGMMEGGGRPMPEDMMRRRGGPRR